MDNGLEIINQSQTFLILLENDYPLNMLKRLLIKSIRFYQKTAPTKVRQSCRFEPSCSEYMIAAVNKYGLIKGIAKGNNRLKRCKIPNGGVDYP